MKISNLVLMALLACCWPLGSAETLGIAQPVARGGVPESDAEALWAMLESKVDRGYRLVTRDALQAVLTEAGLANASGLVDPDGTRTEPGKLKGVRYLLITTLSRLGNGLNVSFAVIDSSTGVVDPERRTTEQVPDLTSLAPRLDGILTKIGLGRTEAASGGAVLLAPVIRIRGAVPGYLAQEFRSRLQSSLLERGVRQYNLETLSRVLHDNGIPDPAAATPSDFARLGGVIGANYLIRPEVTRFEFVTTTRYNELSGTETSRSIGYFQGEVRVIDSHTGEVIAALPFKEMMNRNKIPASVRKDYTERDYGEALIDAALPALVEKIAPAIKTAETTKSAK